MDGRHRRRRLRSDRGAILSATEQRTTTGHPGHEDPFHHEALFYAGDDGFLAGTLPFLRDALVADEPTMVCVDTRKGTMLESALGGVGGRVLFADMAEVGRNPGRIISAWHDFVDSHPGQAVRGIGEPAWPERSSEELVECHHHEALLNAAFADRPSFRLLCPYDSVGLGPEALAVAHCTHPHLCEDGAERRSDAYREAGLDPLRDELPPVPESSEELRFERQDLRGLRGFVMRRARQAGLGKARASDLVLAVSELAANSGRHGGGGGTMRIWSEDRALRAEVADKGRIHDPLVGRRRPSPDEPSGRGLYLVHHLCDLVQIRSDADGTRVRVSMGLD